MLLWNVGVVLWCATPAASAEMVVETAPRSDVIDRKGEVNDAPNQGFSFEATGLRLGISSQGRGKRFYEAEVFVSIQLPAAWDLGRGAQLQMRLDFSGGILGDDEKEAGIFRVGPTLTLRRPDRPVSFEVGLGPTLLTRAIFNSKDFGLPLQFTSHLGINYDIGKSWRIGYRFQHMSNGGLEAPNPGLNLHVFGLIHGF